MWRSKRVDGGRHLGAHGGEVGARGARREIGGLRRRVAKAHSQATSGSVVRAGRLRRRSGRREGRVATRTALALRRMPSTSSARPGLREIVRAFDDHRVSSPESGSARRWPWPSARSSSGSSARQRACGARTARVEMAAARRIERRSGSRPASGRRRGLSGVGLGHRRQQGPRVGMARPLEELGLRRRSRRCGPRYITATRWLTWRTAPRLCEMKSSASAELRCRSASRFRICACTETSSAEVGLVADDDARARRRARGRCAIRWRWPPLKACGIAVGGVGAAGRRASSISRDARRRSRGASGRSGASGSPTMSRDRQARVERRDRVLEHHLQMRGGAAASRARQVGDVARRRSAMRPAVGAQQPQDHARERASCRSRSRRRGRASRPARDGEGDVVDGAQASRRPTAAVAATARSTCSDGPSLMRSRSSARRHAAARQQRHGAASRLRRCEPAPSVAAQRQRSRRGSAGGSGSRRAARRRPASGPGSTGRPRRFAASPSASAASSSRV